jgi:radical SAM protein with 4Fe4S-binding SPASM domain
MPKIIVNRTKEILDFCENSKIVLNLSIDEIFYKHDEIRGVNDNFEKIIETFQGLKLLKEEYKNLDLGIHSVVSKFNVKSLSSVYAFITNELDPDSYICSPAQNRSELLNLNDDIAPDIKAYEKWVDLLRLKTKQDYMVKKGISKIIQAARLKYYDLAIEELKLKKQIIPCFAGFASCQITPYGDVWPCCTLAYDANMGNLRDVNYSFNKIWRSKNAERIRTGIKNGLCNCPMANIHYTNMLCNIPIMIKLIGNIFIN